jgi:hypothetical protein
MTDLSLKTLLRVRYSFPRIQWLVGIISAVTLIFLASALGQPSLPNFLPKVQPYYFLLYFIIFFCMIIDINLIDISRINDNQWKTVFLSMIVTIADLTVISSAELLCLLVLGAFPQDYINGLFILLLFAFPASLGTIVLSSLTTRELKNQSQKLYEELKQLHKKLDQIDSERKADLQAIQEIQQNNQDIFKQIESIRLAKGGQRDDKKRRKQRTS